MTHITGAIPNPEDDNIEFGAGAKLGGPENYLARNTFQNNATGALAAATDDTIARNEHANTFLLDSGEVDTAGITYSASHLTEGWTP